MPGSSVVLPTGENAPSLMQQPNSIVSQNAGFLGPSMLNEPLLTDHALPREENAYVDPKRVRLNEGDGSSADKRVGKRELMRAGVQRFFASTSLFKMSVGVKGEWDLVAGTSQHRGNRGRSEKVLPVSRGDSPVLRMQLL